VPWLQEGGQVRLVGSTSVLTQKNPSLTGYKSLDASPPLSYIYN